MTSTIELMMTLGEVGGRRKRPTAVAEPAGYRRFAAHQVRWERLFDAAPMGGTVIRLPSWPVTAPHVSLSDIEAAAHRLQGVLRPTRTRRAEALSRALGVEVWIKPEHLQRAGSFKIRGAYNRIAQLEPGVEVVAASAGNHAQGVALASSLTDHRATIFMPENASVPKVQATEDYGATVMLGGSVLDECIASALAFAHERDAVFVPPFDDPAIVAGQGTLGLELAEELDAAGGPRPTVLIPTGGGGLLAGSAVALRARLPHARIIGVEAEGAAATAASLRAGEVITLPHISTMADGIALRAPGRLPFELIRSLVDDVVTVSEEAISQAGLLLLERAKSVVEPSGAVGIAALLQGSVHCDGPAVAVLSGGNVDPLLLTSIIRQGLTAAGRYARLRIVFPDRPGSLAALTAAIAAMGINVLDVEHHRFGVTLSVNEVEVEVTVETRRREQRDELLVVLAEKGFRAELAG
jgi:threonine dehydratase